MPLSHGTQLLSLLLSQYVVQLSKKGSHSEDEYDILL